MPMRSVVLSVTICLLSCLISASAMAAPKAVVEPQKINLGVIKKGDVAKSSVTVRNEGDQPLELTKIQVSCPSCLVLDTQQSNVIAPGASLVLPIQYNSEGKHGELAATISIGTNDPANPFLIVEIEVNVKALYLTKPEKVYEFGLAPRGYETKKTLTIIAGEKNASIEVLEVHMEQPSMTVQPEQGRPDEYSRVNMKFTIDPTTPLGEMKNTMVARLRIGTEETELRMPVQGNVLGDVLVLPPAIIDPIKFYKQGENISEITVRATTNVQCPKVLGALAVGPLKASIAPNPPENKYVISVSAADNAPGGPRSGTVYIMTASKDEPIVGIPVYFKIAKPIMCQPENAVFSLANGAPPAQRIRLTSPDWRPFTIKEVRCETDLLKVNIITPSPTKDAAAEIEIVPTGAFDPARAAAMAVVVTDCPGAEELLVPVLIKQQ